MNEENLGAEDRCNIGSREELDVVEVVYQRDNDELELSQQLHMTVGCSGEQLAPCSKTRDLHASFKKHNLKTTTLPINFVQ